MVHRLIAKKLLRPLDRAKLTHFDKLDPKFLNQKFDPGNQYSIPYFWGTTGIGYNAEMTGRPSDSWDALFDAKYKGRISMLDDGRELFALEIQRMGRGVKETDSMGLTRQE